MSFLSVDGTQLHYQVLQPMEPRPGLIVVFLHGLVMDNLSSWFFTVANPVAQHCRVLLYDMRGHGMSDRPQADYGIARHMQDLNELLTEVAAADKVILVGNSFGGLLALNFARHYQSRVAGLVLVDAQINDQAWREDMLKSLRLEGEERNEKIASNFQNWLGRHSARKSNRLARNAHELIYETTLLDDLQVSGYLHAEDLQAIVAPVVAIYGQNSDIIDNAESLKKNLAHCRLHIIEGSTHSVLWEQTEVMRELILTTLDGMAELKRERLVH